MAIDNCQRSRHSLEAIVYNRAHYSWAREKFEDRNPQTAGFANNGAALLLL